MATLSFRGGETGTIYSLSGSGVGFYGSTFGTSVNVGSFQDTTWVTNSTGTTQGPQLDNIKWTHASSGSINGASSKLLTEVPNYLVPLNIRFNHSTAVKTQNVKLRIYDRLAINSNPSGVTCYVADIVHPDTSQTNNGSGSATWTHVFGSTVVLDLTASPGVSGNRPNGASTTDTDHDWYIALSASPDSIGSKTQFGLYVELEYL
jgi:hypothetical protein